MSLASTDTDTDIDAKPGAPGASVYGRVALLIYDYFVLGFMSNLVWRCPTATVMLPFFRANVAASTRHLDIGVGTGYFPANGRLPPGADLTLCDLSPTALDAAAARVARPAHTTRVLHDVLEPLPPALGHFDSISMLYLLHCLPGPQDRKADVLKNLKHRLAPGGVLFGSTILGEEGNHTWLARVALRRINRKQRMGNLADRAEVFEEVLRKNYKEVRTWCVGSVFLFEARGAIL